VLRRLVPLEFPGARRAALGALLPASTHAREGARDPATSKMASRLSGGTQSAHLTNRRHCPQICQMSNHLYYGDNLDILRSSVADESIDLVYLDPPFNSQANYNVLFKAPSGQQSKAQIEAFEDTWHWHDATERAFDEVINSGNADAAEMLRAMRSFLKENDMMAYLTMMAVRLIELDRVLKPTDSLYLHCDSTASHYLKVMLDVIFGADSFSKRDHLEADDNP
jgi:DNA modification methylase